MLEKEINGNKYKRIGDPASSVVQYFKEEDERHSFGFEED